jgi:hypothetical protein
MILLRSKGPQHLIRQATFFPLFSCEEEKHLPDQNHIPNEKMATYREIRRFSEALQFCAEPGDTDLGKRCPGAGQTAALGRLRRRSIFARIKSQ